MYTIIKKRPDQDSDIIICFSTNDQISQTPTEKASYLNQIKQAMLEIAGSKTFSEAASKGFYLIKTTDIPQTLGKEIVDKAYTYKD